VIDGHPLLRAELLFGVLAEGALSVDDLLARRTRLSLVPSSARAAAPVAQVLLNDGLERLQR